VIEAAGLSFWLLAIPLAAAVALTPWGALLGLGLLVHLPGIAPPPGDIAAFGSTLLLVPAGALLGAELVLRRREPAWTVWEVLNLPVRLLLPPGLIVLAAAGTGWTPELAGPAALALAAAAYGTLLRWGWGLASEARGRIAPLRTLRGAAAGSAGAALLAAGAVWLPVPVAVIAALGLVLASVFGRPALSAGPLAPRLVQDLALSTVGDGGWREGASLPRWVRRESPGETQRPTVRGAPALLHGEGRGRGTRAGWIVIHPEGPHFLFRGPARTWSVPFEGAHVHSGLPPAGGLLNRMVLARGDDALVLAVSRGGPSPEEIERELAAQGRRSRV
jgi:hypothetical protein